ncbi:MAG: ribonuclease G [Pseudomonadota bacterium]|nr:ribonuclease G [Pseudomonadota bacterium]
MNEEILVNVTPQETRAAVVENGMLQEVHIERVRGRGIVGNIYKGKVVRVLPGMQAAFVEIGLARTAFLHVRDLISRSLNGNGNGKGGGVSGVENSEPEIPPIDRLLRNGQELLVQVVKDPISTKGARLTTQITIPSRNLVYLPENENIGISQRIQDGDVREFLNSVVETLCKNLSARGGFIIRTAAESAQADELRTDMDFLCRAWGRVERRNAEFGAPALIHEDLPLALRVIRDLVWENVEKVRIDSRESYAKARQFAQELVPEAAEKIEHYPGERPIFDLYSVEDEIQKALEKKVMLKSGGHLVIDQTEAMTTIDVNTGGYVGRRNLEETIFKTNLEAAQALARQIRLRNIGGIIIVDFIDMEVEEHRRQVQRALERELERDTTRTQLPEMSPLGLVEITRKRTRESLERLLTGPCPSCGGRGVQKTPETVCYEIFREIMREARQFEAKEYMVVASPVVVDMLLDEESTGFADLQEFIGRPIRLQVEATNRQEDYDVVLM